MGSDGVLRVEFQESSHDGVMNGISALVRETIASVLAASTM